MSQVDLYTLAGSTLFVIGLYALIVRPHLLHKVIALNVSSAGIFFVFVGIARRVPGPVPDPVPHAMVLTGIVVTVSATAYALALAKRVYTVTGSAELDVPGAGREDQADG